MYRAPREWTRLHVISPLLGGWPVIGLVASIVLYNRAPDWVGVDEVTQDLTTTLTRVPLWFAVGALVVLLVTIGFGYVQWRVHQFRLGAEAIHQRKGIVFRQERQAPLDRLQAIDVVQPLLARVFGFAALNIEVAGGENSGVALEYLRLGDAEAMRNELLAIAAGVKQAKARGEDTTADAVAQQLAAGTEEPVQQADKPAWFAGASVPEGAVETAAAPEREIYRVPVGRLLGSIVLSGPFLFVVSIPVVTAIVVLVLPI